MNKNVMFILFTIISIALGFGAQHLVKLIARKVENRVAACTFSCFIGVFLVMVLLIVAYLVVPSIVRVAGEAISIGVMI